MNRFTWTCTLLAALAPITPAQDRHVSTTFVVRHDPSVIRLTHSLLGSLLTKPRERMVQSRVFPELPVDGPLMIDADIAGDAQDSEGQPAGVFVAQLTVRLSPRAPTVVDDDRLFDELLGVLHKEIEERLSEPFHQTEVQLDRIEKQRKTKERELSDLLDLVDGLPATSLSAAEDARLRTTALMADAELEERTEEPVLELLQKLLSEANTKLEGASHQRDGAARMLRQLEADGAALPGPNQRASDQQRAALRELPGKINAWQEKHDDSTRELARAAERVQELAAEVDRATVGVHRLRSRWQVLAARLKETEATVELAREQQSRRRAYQRRIDILSGEVDRLLARQQEVSLQRSLLQQVRIQRW